jgi:hypothetical protein
MSESFKNKDFNTKEYLVLTNAKQEIRRGLRTLLPILLTLGDSRKIKTAFLSSFLLKWKKIKLLLRFYFQYRNYRKKLILFAV